MNIIFACLIVFATITISYWFIPIIVIIVHKIREHKQSELKDLMIEELEAIKAEFEDKILLNQTVAIQIIDKHLSELKGENNG